MSEVDQHGETTLPGAGGGAPEELAPRTRLELTARLTEELSRFGAAGEVRVSDQVVVLEHPAGPRREPIDHWVWHWPHLDEATRRTRISQLARRLARPTSLPASRPAPAAGSRIWSWLGVLVLVLGAGTGLVWAAGQLGPDRGAAPPRAPTSSLQSASVTEGSGVERAALVCARTRARVVRGATVSIADAEGWVVEYLAFRPVDAGESAPMHESAALAVFFEAPSSPAGSRYVWPEEPALVPPSGAAAGDRVLVRPEAISGATPATHTAVRVTFDGALVDAYFRPEQRTAYFHLASALTEALGASQAALYARCAEGDSHHLGSWFRGRDHHEAVVALVYSLGTFADPPHLSAPYLRPLGESGIDRAYAFASIARVAAAVDRPLLASLLGREGGMVMGRPGEVVTVTFPFDDGNRASRLSREITRLTEIGGP